MADVIPPGLHPQVERGLQEIDAHLFSGQVEAAEFDAWAGWFGRWQRQVEALRAELAAFDADAVIDEMMEEEGGAEPTLLEFILNGAPERTGPPAETDPELPL